MTNSGLVPHLSTLEDLNDSKVKYKARVACPAGRNLKCNESVKYI